MRVRSKLATAASWVNPGEPGAVKASNSAIQSEFGFLFPPIPADPLSSHAIRTFPVETTMASAWS